MPGEADTREYVRFRLAGDDASERFAALEQVYAVLAAFKTEQCAEWDAGLLDDDATAEIPDATWLGLFPERVRPHFEVDEPERVREVWRTHPIAATPTGASAGLRWGVFGLLESLSNAEYRMRGLERLTDELAEWRFEALAYPYGGVGSLVGLIEGFGFEIVEIHDGVRAWTPPSSR